ncbi:hypothetical protein BH18ACI3_BH18ACI3_18780 [soil metagenome]
MMTNRVFLDTSFSLAAAITNDVNHEKAKEISKTLETSRTKIITTQAIVLEIGNALARGKHLPAAVENKAFEKRTHYLRHLPFG